MKYKGVIFDLDGTLVNTIEDIADSMNLVLKNHKQDIYSYAEYKKLVGKGFNNLIIDTFNLALSDKDLLNIREELDKEYSKRYLDKSKPYNDINKLLSELSDLNIMMAINTNKKDEYAKDIIKKLFPKIGFIDIIGQSEKYPIKPNPEGVNNILGKMNLKSEEVLYVGDSNVDIITGQNAGLSTVGVSWGFRGKKELEEYNADFIIDDPLELISILKNK